MKQSNPIQHEQYPDTHHDAYSRTTFGFWMYILSDFILFGTLFATYAVLHNNTFGGPSGKELFNMPMALLQTLILLICSFTIGLASASAHRKNKNLCLSFLVSTFVLGIIFMGVEFSELSRLIQEGNSWKRSAFLSAYFTVIGTHGIHVLFALLWIPVLGIPVLREGITFVSVRRLTCLKMFWQFINIVWIFIFSFVYMMA
jgi:cytochrome o ubiquinol oxidase subunit 3